MLPLAKDEELKSHKDVKVCYICGKRILGKLPKSISYQKVRDHCYYTGKYRSAADSACNLKFNVLNETLLVSHIGSNYHLVIKELANKFEAKFECLG